MARQLLTASASSLQAAGSSPLKPVPKMASMRTSLFRMASSPTGQRGVRFEKMDPPLFQFIEVRPGQGGKFPPHDENHGDFCACLHQIAGSHQAVSPIIPLAAEDGHLLAGNIGKPPKSGRRRLFPPVPSVPYRNCPFSTAMLSAIFIADEVSIFKISHPPLQSEKWFEKTPALVTRVKKF